MSTRAQIRIIENEGHKDLYCYADGYFDGAGKELTEILKIEHSGMDRFIKKLIEEYGDAYESTDGIHVDIEYYYELDFDKKKFIGYKLKWPPTSEDTRFDDLYPKFNFDKASIDLFPESFDLIEDKSKSNIEEVRFFKKNEIICVKRFENGHEASKPFVAAIRDALQATAVRCAEIEVLKMQDGKPVIEVVKNEKEYKF